MQLTSQLGMNDATAEDRGKRYLRLSQLLNKDSLLRKDACCGFSLLSASRSTTAVFHQPNRLLCRLTSHLCLTTDYDDKESEKSRQGRDSRRGRCMHWKVIEASIAIPLSSISDCLANVTLEEAARSRVGQGPSTEVKQKHEIYIVTRPAESIEERE
jgi:hypothetical protein